MKKKKILAIVLTLAMALCLFAGCGSSDSGTSTPAPEKSAAPAEPSAAPEASDAPSGDDTASATGTFKIGGIGPLTGDAAIYGTAVMNAIKIAVDEINAKGGAQFEFKEEDDVADGETAVNAYNTLMDWGMQVLVGPVTTGSAISVSAEVYNDRVFALTPSATSADVTAGKDNMFQMCFTDPNQGITSAKYMAENMSGSKIAVIYRNDDAYSQGIRDAFVAEVGKLDGIEVVYEGTFTKDTQTDFSVQLTAAQSANADVVFLPIYYQPISVILNQAKNLGYAPLFFGVDGMDGILAMEGFDTSLADGVMLMTPFNAWGTDELTANFVAEYEKRYGETPNQFAADAYDCVYAIYDALNACGASGDMSAEELCDKLVETFTSGSFSYDGITGNSMTWGTNGEISKAASVFVIKDGIYVNP